MVDDVVTGPSVVVIIVVFVVNLFFRSHMTKFLLDINIKISVKRSMTLVNLHEV